MAPNLLQESRTEYTVSIGEATSKTTVTATATDSDATVMMTIDGETMQSAGNVSREIIIDQTGGSKELRIRVRAEDGTLGEETYTLTINRDLSSNVQLTKITVEGPRSNQQGYHKIYGKRR